MGGRHLVLPGSLFRQGEHPGQARAHAQLVRALHRGHLFDQMVHFPAELGLIHVQALQDELEEPVRLAAHGRQQMDRGQFGVIIHDSLLLGSLHQASHFITQAFCLHNKHLQIHFPIKWMQLLLFRAHKNKAREAFSASRVLFYTLKVKKSNSFFDFLTFSLFFSFGAQRQDHSLCRATSLYRSSPASQARTRRFSVRRPSWPHRAARERLSSRSDTCSAPSSRAPVRA